MIVILFLTVAVQAFLLMPALGDASRILAHETRINRERNEDTRTFHKLLGDSKRQLIVQQAQIVSQQEASKRLTEENLRLITELSKRLKGEK